MILIYQSALSSISMVMPAHTIFHNSRANTNRCSEPAEWSVQPYKPCQVRWSSSNTSATSSSTNYTTLLSLEIASSLYPFDGLLMCVAKKGLVLRYFVVHVMNTHRCMCVAHMYVCGTSYMS
jgi:hypothetical protein